MTYKSKTDYRYYAKQIKKIGTVNQKNFIRFLLEYIFSVKNSENKKHKIITIFGIKIKIKRSQKEENKWTIL